MFVSFFFSFFLHFLCRQFFCARLCLSSHRGPMWHANTHITHLHLSITLTVTVDPPTSLVLPSTNSLPLMSDQPISCSCFMMSYDTCLWLVDFSCLKLFLYLKDDIRNDKDYWKKKKNVSVTELHSSQLSVPLEIPQWSTSSSSVVLVCVMVPLVSGSSVCGSVESLCIDADGCFSGGWRWRGRLILC